MPEPLKVILGVSRFWVVLVGLVGWFGAGMCPNLPQRRPGPGSAVSGGAEYQRFFSRAPVRSGSLWQIWTACVAAGPGQGLGRGVRGLGGGRAGASASEWGPWAAVTPFWGICGDPVGRARRPLRSFTLCCAPFSRTVEGEGA